jgi:CRP-like cAMP-binding protein
VIPINRENFVRRFAALGSALAPAELDALMEALEVRDVLAGEALIAEETVTDALYLVWDGELNVSMKTPPDGAEKEVAKVGAGALLGEVSLLDPGKATATVRTLEGCVALVLPRARLEAFWKREPRAASALLREVSRAMAVRIRAASARLAQLQAAAPPTSAAGTGATPEPGAALAAEVVGVHGMLYQGGRS